MGSRMVVPDRANPVGRPSGTRNAPERRLFSANVWDSDELFSQTLARALFHPRSKSRSLTLPVSNFQGKPTYFLTNDTLQAFTAGPMFRRTRDLAQAGPS